MFKSKLSSNVSLAAWVTIACSSVAQGVVPVRTVAVSGQQASGAGAATFESFGLPVVDNKGRSAFWASLTIGQGGVTSEDSSGIWSEGGGTFELVARQGSQAPSTPPGANFEFLSDPAIGGLGRAAFHAMLGSGTGGVDANNDEGIWSQKTGSLALVAREGDTAPGTSGGLLDSFIAPVVDDAGRSAFFAYLKIGQGDATADNSSGIWSEGNGSLALVARQGSVAPGTSANFDFLGNPVISSAGRTAFSASLTGPGQDPMNDYGIWSEGGGALALVVRKGAPAPGTMENFGDLGDPVINAAGRTAFAATLDNFVAGIWSEGTGALTLVALEGTQAPGTTQGATFAPFFSDPVIDSQGRTAFYATLSGTGVDSTNDEGIWAESGPGTGPALVARKGDPATGTTSDFDIFDFPSISSAGHVVFWATLTGTGVTTGVNDIGIWQQNAGGGLTLLARTGESIEVAPGDSRMVTDLFLQPPSGGEDGRPRCVNSADQVTFFAAFADGSTGIFVTVGPDSDSDGVNDAFDNCPNTPNSDQADTDTDGVGDVCDGCPNDPNKAAAGTCGCGAPDTDTDGDSTPDCIDGCPNDANKTAAGACGCGAADTDSDNDGTADCNDGCPGDANKVAPGVCGCGVSDADANGNGVPDCDDSPIGSPTGGCGGAGACGAGAQTMTGVSAALVLSAMSRRRRRRL